MLFLFKGELKGEYPLPPEQFLEVAVKQTETLTSYRQQGKVLAGGIMAGRKGGYAIFDVESSEELHRLVSQLPMNPFIETEITPLISYEHASESAKQVLASLAAAKK